MADLRFNLIPAGADTFIGGQDASKIPDRISDECYAAGVNVSVRRASVQPRWGFDRIPINYPDEVILDPFQRERTIQSLFEGGKFQALTSCYIGDYQYIIIVVSGIIYALNPDTFNLVRIPIADGTMLNPRAARINWTAAGKYLVLYDYPANPVIVNGFSARRSVLANMEIPVSTQGAFNENRLFVANNGSEFVAGDPVGNPLIVFQLRNLAVTCEYSNLPVDIPTVDNAVEPFINPVFARISAEVVNDKDFCSGQILYQLSFRIPFASPCVLDLIEDS